MELISNKKLRTQRRIIVETPQLVALFDVLHSLLSLESEGRDIPVPIDAEDFFEETTLVLEEFVDAIVEKVVNRIETSRLITLVQSAKTGKMSVDAQAILEVINTLISTNRDEVISILAKSLRLVLIETCQSILNEMLEADELMNFKKVTIKTRRHVVVLC